MPGDCITPAEVTDLANKDTQRLQGTIAAALAANSVYMNVIGGGVFPSGVSDEIKSTVQMQAAPGDSLALPTFECDTDVCGTVGLQDLTDTINFLTRLETKRGFGPRICVKQGYAAFRSSYSMAEDSLKKLIVQYMNADIRAQLYLRSASKFTAASGWDFNSLFVGGTENDLGVKFATNLLPDGPMTFKALQVVARHMREVLFAPWFASNKGMPHFRFVGGSDQVEYFRSEVGVENVLLALTQGSFRFGETALTSYSFESSPAYRGIAFGVDHRPLRATGFKADGTLNLVDPVIVVTNAAKNTAYAQANPAWLAAELEVGMLIAEGSFERWVPERFVGEGSFRFAPQLHMGELDWHYQVDNDCNVWGDYGWHKYQIIRAYKPLRPQFVVPILYKRCTADLGLTVCDPATASSFTGADSFVTIGECSQ